MNQNLYYCPYATSTYELSTDQSKLIIFDVHQSLISSW
jgi:hypothetical protein